MRRDYIPLIVASLVLLRDWVALRDADRLTADVHRLRLTITDLLDT